MRGEVRVSGQEPDLQGVGPGGLSFKSSTVTSRLAVPVWAGLPLSTAATVRRWDCCLSLSSSATTLTAPEPGSSSNISSELPETMEKLNWEFRGRTSLSTALRVMMLLPGGMSSGTLTKYSV